ncbi:MAG: hypothetical protein Q8L87_10285 [Anaerolineales bacterium]|jgi:hypothetical protein|nr:hypothetical protein [Anaerolineales bacterium]
MINKSRNFKVFNIITVFFLATLLLTACGSFNFQAQAAPNDEGGVDINGGVDPVVPVVPVAPEADTTEPAPTGQSLTPIIIILLLAGFGVLVLILVLLARRPSSDEMPH